LSVVLRCPTCGTTQPVVGECEACHDAQVRYFCTNHTPGLWLDEPTCPRCGSRFGEASSAARPRTTSPVSASPVSASPVSVSPASASPARSPHARARAAAIGASRRADVDGRSAPLSRTEGESSEPPFTPAQPFWLQLLRAGLRARSASRAARASAALPVARNLVGCVVRIALLGLFLLIAIVVALFIFGRSLLQGLQPY